MISAGKKTSFALISVVLTFVMIISGAVASFAADSGITGSKVATPTELSDSIKETEVTLQIPAVKETDKYDIVFVMDSSSSTSDSHLEFDRRVEDLVTEVEALNVDVRIGVIKYRGVAFDTISLATDGARSGLVEYSDTTKADIFSGINYSEQALKNISSGSNIHGGLVLADELLSADNEVADSHKYVILVTDGKSYIWYNSSKEATSFYVQHADKNNNYISNSGIPEVAQVSGSMNKDNGYTVGGIDNFWFADYADLYSYTGPMLSELSGSSAYDTRCLYAYKGATDMGGTVTEHPITNWSYLNTIGPVGNEGNQNFVHTWYEFTPSAEFSSIRFLTANPYVVVENGGSYEYDYSQVNPDFYRSHPDQLQKGLYLAGHKWTEMGAKYNNAVIGFDGNTHGKLNGVGLAIAKSFFNWILSSDISDVSANIYGPSGVFNETAIQNVFDSIENKINYLIKTGTVTDEITDEFELIKNGVDTFTVKLDGVAVTGVADGENKWNFGELTGGSYPYVVEYNEGTKTITWKINVPVQDSKPISLTYRLEIEDGAENGVHDTNRSATLEYESFNGNTDTYTFPVPETEYTFTPITEVKFTKTYIGGEGYDNAGDEVDPIGKLNETLSFTVKPYKSFNREIGKTAIPVFTPDTYTITAGTEAAEVTATLPDYSGADAGIGDYWYEVKETAGTTAGVVYDTTTYYLHVQVVLRGAGVTVSQVALHKTAPADDGSYTNTADNKTEGFTNEYSAGEVTVTKKVTGNMGDKNKPFDITVTFTAPEGKTVTGDIKYTENGTEKTIAAGAEGWTGNKSVTISIKDGASVTFTNVPDGVTYTVVEADYTVDGYDAPDYAFDNATETGDTVTADGASGKISDSADKLTVTNNKTSTIDVGVIVENAPFVLAIALVITAALLMFLKKRKKAEDDE